jgi:hypothetical protein
MRWEGEAWAGGAVAGEATAGGAWGASEEPDPFEEISDDFSTGVSDLEERGWSFYKSSALAQAEVVDDAMQVIPIRGGGGDYQGGGAIATASFWYTQSNVDQRDGLLVYKAVGPAAGTPVSFDARARVIVTNEDGDDVPPATVGEWRFAGFAVHHPTRTSYLRYLHIGLGSEGGAAVTGIECKVNRVNASGGMSVFPVEEVDVTGLDALEYDLRIVRRASDTQVFDMYTRPVSSGEALTSNDGWTLHYTVVWTDGEDAADDFPACPQETDDPFPDDVQLGVMNYSNAEAVDVMVRVPRIVVLATTD